MLSSVRAGAGVAEDLGDLATPGVTLPTAVMQQTALGMAAERMQQQMEVFWESQSHSYLTLGLSTDTLVQWVFETLIDITRQQKQRHYLILTTFLIELRALIYSIVQMSPSLVTYIENYIQGKIPAPLLRAVPALWPRARLRPVSAAFLDEEEAEDIPLKTEKLSFVSIESDLVESLQRKVEFHEMTLSDKVLVESYVKLAVGLELKYSGSLTGDLIQEAGSFFGERAHISVELLLDPVHLFQTVAKEMMQHKLLRLPHTTTIDVLTLEFECAARLRVGHPRLYQNLFMTDTSALTAFDRVLLVEIEVFAKKLFYPVIWNLLASPDPVFSFAGIKPLLDKEFTTEEIAVFCDAATAGLLPVIKDVFQKFKLDIKELSDFIHVFLSSSVLSFSLSLHDCLQFIADIIRPEMFYLLKDNFSDSVFCDVARQFILKSFKEAMDYAFSFFAGFSDAIHYIFSHVECYGACEALKLVSQAVMFELQNAPLAEEFYRGIISGASLPTLNTICARKGLRERLTDLATREVGAFLSDFTLLNLATTVFDEEDIRRDYQEFVRIHVAEVRDLSDEALQKKITEVVSGKRSIPLVACIFEQYFRSIGFYPNPVQMLNLLIMIKQERCMAEINTGEGKSTIIAMLALYFRVIEKGGLQKVRIITFSQDLVDRDAIRYKPFFRAFRFNVLDQSDIAYFTFWTLAAEAINPQAKFAEPVGLSEAIILLDEADKELYDSAFTGFRLASPCRMDESTKKVIESCYRPILEFCARVENPSLPKDVLWQENSRALISRLITLITPFEYKDKFERNKEILPLLFEAGMLARTLREGVDYVVEEKGAKKTVVLLDKSTGEFLYGTTWDEPLHSMILTRHGLPVSRKHDVFLSYSRMSMLLSARHVFALTGTAGDEAEQEMARNFLGLPLYRSPCFAADEREQLSDVLVAETDHLAVIVSHAMRYSSAERPVVIICDNFQLSEAVFHAFPKGVALCYNRPGLAAVLSSAGHAGKITVGSPYLARGADIRLSPQARAAGGMVVIIASPMTARGERQAAGRCARNGDPGAFINILAIEHVITAFPGSCHDVANWRENRHQQSTQYRRLVERQQQKNAIFDAALHVYNALASFFSQAENNYHDLGWRNVYSTLDQFRLDATISRDVFFTRFILEIDNLIDSVDRLERDHRTKIGKPALVLARDSILRDLCHYFKVKYSIQVFEQLPEAELLLADEGGKLLSQFFNGRYLGDVLSCEAGIQSVFDFYLRNVTEASMVQQIEKIHEALMGMLANELSPVYKKTSVFSHPGFQCFLNKLCLDYVESQKYRNSYRLLPDRGSSKPLYFIDMPNPVMILLNVINAPLGTESVSKFSDTDLIIKTLLSIIPVRNVGYEVNYDEYVSVWNALFTLISAVGGVSQMVNRQDAEISLMSEFFSLWEGRVAGAVLPDNCFPMPRFSYNQYHIRTCRVTSDDPNAAPSSITDYDTFLKGYLVTSKAQLYYVGPRAIEKIEITREQLRLLVGKINISRAISVSDDFSCPYYVSKQLTCDDLYHIKQATGHAPAKFVKDALLELAVKIFARITVVPAVTEKFVQRISATAVNVLDSIFERVKNFSEPDLKYSAGVLFLRVKNYIEESVLTGEQEAWLVSLNVDPVTPSKIHQIFSELMLERPVAPSVVQGSMPAVLLTPQQQFLAAVALQDMERLDALISAGLNVNDVYVNAAAEEVGEVGEPFSDSESDGDFENVGEDDVIETLLMRALFIAVKNNKTTGFTYLLAMLADPRILSETEWDGKTLLQLAAEGGNVLFVTELLNNVVSQDEQTDAVQAFLAIALDKGHVGLVRYLLNGRLSSEVNFEQRMLFTAIEKGHVALVCYLIETYPTHANVSVDDIYPLYHAILSLPAKVQRLRQLPEAERELSPLIRQVPPAGMEYVLHSNPVDEYMLDAAPTEIERRAHLLKIIRYLVKQGADVNSLNGPTQDSPLCLAISRGCYSSFTMLLGAAGIKVDSALAVAISSGDDKYILPLLERGAMLPWLSVFRWYSRARPALLGCVQSFFGLVRAEHKAIKKLREPADTGDTIFHFLFRELVSAPIQGVVPPDVVEIRVRYLEVLMTHIGTGCFNKPNARGEIPLDILIEHKKFAVIEALMSVSSGVIDVNREHAQGRTLLFYALTERDFGLALRLLKRGADPTIAVLEGKSILTIALEANAPDAVIKAILENGARATLEEKTRVLALAGQAALFFTQQDTWNRRLPWLSAVQRARFFSPSIVSSTPRVDVAVVEDSKELTLLRLAKEILILPDERVRNAIITGVRSGEYDGASEHKGEESDRSTEDVKFLQEQLKTLDQRSAVVRGFFEEGTHTLRLSIDDIRILSTHLERAIPERDRTLSTIEAEITRYRGVSCLGRR